MKMSVRAARANFAHALDLAEKGEVVTITKNGKAIAELGPPSPARDGTALQRMQAATNAAGRDSGALTLPSEFDDPAFSRAVSGPHD